MNLTLTILGSASAMPMSDRNPSAQALSVQGRLFLIDCGEGTQQQIRRCHLSFLKIEAIFISHIHGDHLFGIFGLLSTMTMYGRTQELHVYGPNALGGVINFYKSYFSDGLLFDIIFHPLKGSGPELIHTSKYITVSAFPLRHKIDCYGFRFDETVTARKASVPGFRPKSYAYCSDTMPFVELPSYVRGVTALYHEATYMNDMADKAALRYHSTTCQAARTALDAGAGKLIVGHYSSRITDFDAFLAECREVFPESFCARDCESFEI